MYYADADVLSVCVLLYNLPPTLLAIFFFFFFNVLQHGSGTDTKNKSHHRKLTLEKKILPPGLEPPIFRSRVGRSAHELFPPGHCATGKHQF